MKKPFFFNSTNILVGIRFIARLMVAGLLIVFITLYFTQPASYKNLSPVGLETKESLLLLSLYVTIAGLILAFKWEGTGGLMALIGLAVFSVLYYTLKGAMLWNIWIMGIPAVMFLICWWFTEMAADYDVYRS